MVQLKGKQESIKIHECFSGNTSKDIQKKAATLSLFNEGISHYLDKSFNKAHEVFMQVIKENPEDRTAAFFFTNTKQVMEEGLSKNREGIVEMQEYLNNFLQMAQVRYKLFHLQVIRVLNHGQR